MATISGNYQLVSHRFSIGLHYRHRYGTILKRHAIGGCRWTTIEATAATE